MRTSAQMIAKYNAKYDLTTLGAARAATADLAKANFAVYVNDWIPYEEGTRLVLDEDGVGQLLRFGYFGFAHQIYHLMKHMAGEAYAEAGATLIVKYMQLGLHQSILEKIADRVFNWNRVITP